MKNLLPVLALDFYKLSHREMAMDNVTKMYETWTARGTRIKEIKDITWFGLQGVIKKWLIEYFKEEYFDKDIKEIIKEYQRVLKYTLGIDNAETKHLEDLHSLGYLPIKICAIEEGIDIPVRTPMMTIENTHKDFAWLVGYLETLISCELWHISTTASIAKRYRKIADEWALKTCGNTNFVDFQMHGFEMRGMSGVNGALNSGAGHLLSFKGSDTVPAYNYLEKYYNADIEKELVMTSIPASEHTLECTYEDDYDYIKTIITDKFPSGFVSIVMDGYDYFKVLTETLPKLKDEILNRNGKVIVRGDSGCPIDITCGKQGVGFGEGKTHEEKGSIELLWDLFGGTINEQGYKVLNEKIGYIYGDSITMDRAEEIFKRLEAKGFASCNVALGIGSYTYQYVTRDTFTHALKCTYAVIEGKEKFVFKNPSTDDGTKKSQKGMVAVYEQDGKIIYKDGLGKMEKKYMQEVDMLKPVFEDGKLYRDMTLQQIRDNVRK